MRCARGGQAEVRGVSAWEYLIVALPKFGAASTIQGQSASVGILNEHGAEGWDAVGMTTLADGTVAALLKRSRSDNAD
jgi:hypothetical protein